jgi:TolB-like protein/Tfp pilus assembly protein PilF
MNAPPLSVAVCSTCGRLLNAKGDCLTCLVLVGFDEPAEAATAPPASLVFGDFEVERRGDGSFWELGRGAMGITYRALDKVLHRTVALKVIETPAAAGDSKAVRERFLREARAAASLRHPNVGGVFRFGASPAGDGCYYARELIEGETLEARVRRDGPLDVELALEIAIQVTRALMTAAAHGLIHRDLKPGNIMLTRAEAATAEVEVKVIDFGLAKATAEACNGMDLTQGGFVGTPSFASPEQFASKAADARSDIYSLGATLWYALTGEVACPGKTIVEIRSCQTQVALPIEQLLARKVPVPVIKLLRRTLSTDPAERPQSARTLLAALELCRAVMEAVPRRRKRLRRAAVALGLFAICAAGLTNYLLRRQHAAAAMPPEKSIALLPFENLSEEKANAYFADGIQDEILTRLSKIADLKVISRTSTQHYKSAPENLPEIARQLGVAHILEGSVQKSGDAVRVNVQLIKAANGSHLWADTFDRKLTDIFSVESEVAKAIADQLRAKLTGQEEQLIAAKPTDNPEAYDAYMRGLAYSLKTGNLPANALAAQKYLGEAVRLDPKFALSWALLSYVDARGYLTLSLQHTVPLREEARQAAETALTLQPVLGEALHAKGYYYYACLKDYDTAVRYFEQARQFLPNNSRIPESLAYVARKRGQWDRSESYFNEAERLDPRNLFLLGQHAQSYIALRRFPEALRKFDQVLDITPDDVHTLVDKAAIAQAEGDLPRASALLTALHPAADDTTALEIQVYQAILEGRPAQIIPRLKEMLANPDPALVGYINGELRFWLGWAQEVAGDHAAASESWRQARSELESFLKQQPENYLLIGDLALTDMGLGDKAAALALSERAMAVNPIEKDAVTGPGPIEVLARVAARTGDPDRAIAALQKLLSIPYSGPLVPWNRSLTPALLRLDPMFDPLRNDPRFQKLAALPAPKPSRR